MTSTLFFFKKRKKVSQFDFMLTLSQECCTISRSHRLMCYSDTSEMRMDL